MKPVYALKAEQKAASFRTTFLNRKVAVSRDGRYVAMAGRLEEENAFVWELPSSDGAGTSRTTPKEFKPRLRPPLRGNNFLEFIGSSYNLMGDGAKIWDVAANREVVTEGGFRPEDGVRPFINSYFDHAMALSQDGRWLLGSPLHDEQSSYYNVAVWEVATGKLLYRYIDNEFELAPKPRFKHNKSQLSFTADNTHFYQVGVIERPDLPIESGEAERGQFALFYYPVMPAGQPKLVPVADFSTKSPELPFAFSPDGEVLEIADAYYLLNPAGSPPQLFHWEFGAGSAIPNREAGFVNKKLIAGQTVLASPAGGQLYLTDLTGQIVSGGELLELVYQEGSSIFGVKSELKLQPRVFGSNSKTEVGRQLVIAGDDNIILVFQLPVG